MLFIKYNNIQLIKQNSRYHPYKFRHQSAIFMVLEDGNPMPKHLGVIRIMNCVW